jgi:hypothetical protein
MTAADYAALEARVSELEHQMRNILPAKVDSIGYGVSVLHGEVTEQFAGVRERLGGLELGQERIGDRLNGHDRRFDAIDRRLDSHGEMLSEILRRLPAGHSNGPAGAEDDH